MDSFLSLFDPSDSTQNKPKKQRTKTDHTQDTAKKKPEQPKGRRRNRRGANKNDTLPEESSFLCDPNLTTDLLVKDVSYIESFIGPSANSDDKNDEGDKRCKRRNSGRKNRRKKKSSPAKDLVNVDFDEDEAKLTHWNNKSKYVPKIDDRVGKNVNDLNKYEINNKFKRKDDWRSYAEKEVNNVIEKLEKVSMKDDMYMAGEFNAKDLENDPFYSSDDLDESFDER